MGKVASFNFQLKDQKGNAEDFNSGSQPNVASAMVLKRVWACFERLVKIIET